ncbi:imidazoleglycerol-phosphate dehydratase [Gloeomargarita lithophora Alchichica-D10]|uniref:Imidazoleglycerol-phosphate dehydratase n=1 Tax=Gloeomargarita lithophora Alchichica-D10 TaxID=1188229 RepID=A0A1J0ABE7_9CYAN|nr:TIGR01548 family HAD-type hydrolase [Gloeomargarita lithophora]APB33256.1 imidazoleglycerol-phosphate dehydratase [Gloeomargarita lithophora Alchichica-D10]
MAKVGVLICDIDGVIRDVRHSYRRAMQATVHHFTNGQYEPTLAQIDQLKSEGHWNNDWLATQELLHRWGRKIPIAAVIEHFQKLYWGDSDQPTGFITQEELLIPTAYFTQLSQRGWQWGFFSGAPRREAQVALDRLGVGFAPLVAMEDAPEKPDPTGLLQLLTGWNCPPRTAVIYAGDTVADMMTVQAARREKPAYHWFACGILPPHVQDVDNYTKTLQKQGADLVLPNLSHLVPESVLI